MQPYVIGIDIGTGSTKAVAITTNGTIASVVQHYYPTLHAQPGYSEQEPDAIWQAFVTCLQDIVQRMQAPPMAISLSSAMHGVLAVDKHGVPLTHLITWADNRSAAIAEELRQLPQGENLYKHTGTPIHPMSPLCKIIWWRQHEEQTFKNAFKFISVKEYIWHQLFHQYQIDHSLASATGLFNINQRKWHTGALAMAGIQEEQLSELVATHYVRTDCNPEIAQFLNLPANMPFCIGASDGCLANAGSFALEPGVAAITVGTSGAVRIASVQPLINYSAMIFNYLLDETTFICGGPVNNGGNVLQWLLNQFMSESGATGYKTLFDQAMLVPPGCKGLLCLPYLSGERAPLWDAKSCGVFFGVTLQHTQPYFIRAALEGVCFSLLHVLQEVEETALPVKQINVSGGFVHSAAWMQLLADITGKRICLYQTEDASALGAAYLALKALKVIDDLEALQPKEQTFIEPDTSARNVYQASFDLFKSLYPRLKEAMHTLYQHNH